MTEQAPPVRAINKKAAFALAPFAAGAGAGIVEALALQPLDVLKTRFQLQAAVNKSDPLYYSGILDAFKKISSVEGPLALWKGIVPPLLALIPQKAVKFGTYDLFFHLMDTDSKKYVGRDSAVAMLAGIMAGPFEALVLCPFEVIKINLQSQGRTPPGQQPLYSGTADAAAKIFKRNPYTLYSGVTPLILRQCSFNVGYFLSYMNIKAGLKALPSVGQPDWTTTMVAGFGAGCVATTLANPWDVVKTRLQQQSNLPFFDESRYQSTFQTISQVFKDEGLPGFYKGYLSRVLRLGTGGAIVFTAYEAFLGFARTRT